MSQLRLLGLNTFKQSIINPLKSCSYFYYLLLQTIKVKDSPKRRIKVISTSKYLYLISTKIIFSQFLYKINVSSYLRLSTSITPIFQRECIVFNRPLTNLPFFSLLRGVPLSFILIILLIVISYTSIRLSSRHQY